LETVTAWNVEKVIVRMRIGLASRVQVFFVARCRRNAQVGTKRNDGSLL
jgi:hypothetical protein